MDAPSEAQPTTGESASDLFLALRRRVAAGAVELHVEPKQLNHIDNPFAVEADGNIWAYGALFVAALLWWRFGMVVGLAALALGVVVYLIFGRTYVHRRIEQRVRRDALDDLEKWRKLWRFAGLTLTAKERPDLAPCTSPDGNWMGFTRALSTGPIAER
jgi:hypothetical protein